MGIDITRTRIELKYLIPPEMIDEIVVRIPADERQEYHVTTIYFDSPDGALSHMALENPYRCAKVRAREYLDGSSHVWFEVKSRTGAWTRKWRFCVEKADVASLLAGGFEINCDSLRAGPGTSEAEMEEARRCLETAAHGRLQPLGAVYAHRRTFELGEMPIRFTLDEQISYYRPPAGLWAAHATLTPDVLGTPLHREPKALLELKHAGEEPLWCSRIVAALTVSAYSKFRTLMQVVEDSRRVVGCGSPARESTEAARPPSRSGSRSGSASAA
jgi:hypothetical protein